MFVLTTYSRAEQPLANLPLRRTTRGGCSGEIKDIIDDAKGAGLGEISSDFSTDEKSFFRTRAIGLPAFSLVLSGK